MGVTLRIVVRLSAVLIGKYFLLSVEEIRKVDALLKAAWFTTETQRHGDRD